MHKGLIIISMGTIAVSMNTATAETLTQATSITSGNMTFSNFSWQMWPGASIFEADVVPCTDPVSGYPGLRLQPVGTASSLVSAALDAYTGVDLWFDVTVTQGSGLVDGFSVRLDGVAPIDGIAQVIATVNLSQATAWLPTTSEIYTALPFASQQLQVSLDMLTWSGLAQSSSLTYVELIFSEIPEPAPLALLVIGGAVGMRRRRLAAAHSGT